MSGETSFLDFVREAGFQQGRGNDEIVRAVLPLIEQVLEHHDEGRVAPLVGVDRIFADGGHLWFHDADASAPPIDHKAIRARERSEEAGVEVVDRASELIDVDARYRSVASKLVGRSDRPVEHPVYLPDYVTWEDEVGHHDALTDIFSLGMLTASLALGADFTEPEELERFVVHRHALSQLVPTIHPVIAKAIVRMTELDRHARAQNLRGLALRLKRYREVDGRADEALDFRKLKGFSQADRSSRRKIIQAHLQSRLFDVTHRNRLIYFRPTLSTLDLTESSVPTRLDVESVLAEDLLLWNETVAKLLSGQKPLRLDRCLRFEETPYARGVLDKIRAQARRDHAELGSSQLRLVVAFFNWHNLRDAPEQRIKTPLLLLPAKLEKKRGVRDSYVLTPTSEVAEVNPVLRHLLAELYELELPEHVDLKETDLETFHKALSAEITRSEPGITLHYLTKPQIRLVHQRARRRLAAWRRRSKVSGRGIRRFGDVSYSYARTNLRPLGLQLFLQMVKPQPLALDEHYQSAQPAKVEERTPEESPEATAEAEPDVTETEREVYQITEEASGRFDWAVDLTHLTLGNFNYRKMSLVRDFDEILEEEEGHEHPAFDLLFSLEARELAKAPDDVDALAPYVVVPADPTQTAALQWGREGKNFIIQGPPGTGKSQTITNLIADFAGRGKHVLFVCEKRAALDVVYHRLAQHGLDELAVLIHDSQADKRAFLTELGATYERWLGALDEKNAPADVSSREAVHAELSEPLDALSRFSASMSGPAAAASASVSEVIREQVSQRSAPQLSAEQRERLPGHAEWFEAREAVYALSRALGDLGESTVIAELPLLDVSSTVLKAERPLAALREGLDAVEGLLDSVREAQDLVRPGATAEELREALALATDLTELADVGQLALLDSSSATSRSLSAGLTRRAELSRALEKAAQKTDGWQEKLARHDLGPALEQARRFDSIFILFLFFLPAWWRLRSVILRHYDFTKHTVKPRWSAVLGELAAEYEEREAIEELDEELRREHAFSGPVGAFEARVEALRAMVDRTPLQVELQKEWSAGDGAVVAALHAAGAQIKALAEALARVFDDADAIAIESIGERVGRVRAASDLLQELRAPLVGLGAAAPSVRGALREIPLAAKELDACVGAVTLERTFADNRPLARFDHAALDRRREQLGERHRAWLEANAEAVRRQVRAHFQARVRLCSQPAAKLDAEEKRLKSAYNAGRRVLEREFKKVMRHRSIRELSSGDPGTVLYDLKPIWLMSPLSISDTIPLAEQRFDVVIFDEASQIPVEEAVPALYRAPQMIVVGDEMQLPPTSFFAAKRESDSEEEANYDLDADSFLTHAARKLPSTMLGWHYRSRSEALIRFSSHAFYDGRLLTVPDQELEVRREPIEVERAEQGDENAARVVDRPISFHRIMAGVYAARRNTEEARYIAHLVRGLLRAEHRQSVGIVAFSEAQQAEIEAALEALARDDDAFSASLEAEYERTEDGQVVGLFVKNLENVQGDERDVIILSICYGPGPNGKMRMNFGPINKGGGEKRLNVVFSRAKRHMALVSSIRYGAITNEYNEGALTFRRYLQYAEAMSVGDADTATLVTQVLTHGPSAAGSVPSPEDPVVDQLAAALAERGYRIERDIGTSAFRVDVGVCRPGDPALVLGLLVDTAAHYENSDLMERYHTRPSVLEAFGWRLQWVLQKDWVADPDACLARIDGAYERALNR